MRKFFVGGNWKMNGTILDCQSWVANVNATVFKREDVDVVVAPPAPYLDLVRKTSHPQVEVAAQNCYMENSGAYTGEVSPAMLHDLKVNWVILGHSERRNIFLETDEFIGKKVAFAVKEGLNVIACIGEKLEEREFGTTKQVVVKQLDALKNALPDASAWEKVVIAYEPVWAIGTGKVASPQQAQEVHEIIREWLKTSFNAKVSENTRIIYGGSVNGKNCAELAMEKDIDGFLVGGASLKPEFAEIIKSFAQKK